MLGLLPLADLPFIVALRLVSCFVCLDHRNKDDAVAAPRQQLSEAEQQEATAGVDRIAMAFAKAYRKRNPHTFLSDALPRLLTLSCM
jgi:hypothetical protein